MNQPEVSIVTPAYNAEKYIGPCIESVLNQTYNNWDMWIVDDASTDATANVVAPYVQEDPRIHYIRLKQNSGDAALPRNVGMDAAPGRFVAFLDSDDIFLPEKLDHQINFMEKKDSAASYTAYRRISPDNENEGHLIHVPEKLTYTQYLSNTCICLSSSMVDRNKIGDIHFDTTTPYRQREDLIFWMDVLKKNNADGLDEDLTRYRRGHESVSSNIVNMMVQNWKIYHDKAKELSEFQRVKAFCGYGINAVKKRLSF